MLKYILAVCVANIIAVSTSAFVKETLGGRIAMSRTTAVPSMR